MKNHPGRPHFGGRFAATAPYGREAELRFADWCKREAIAYFETSRLDDLRAAPPRLIVPTGTRRLPDFVLFADGRTALAEVKRHARTSLHHATRREVTGVEQRYWQDYEAVAACAGLPLFVVFEHDEGPQGFVGGEVAYLRSRVSHRHSDMIFWPISALRRIEARDDLGFLPHDMWEEYPPDDPLPAEGPGSGIADLDFGAWP